MAAKKAKKNAAKRSKKVTADKGEGLKVQPSRSGGKRRVVRTMPSVIMGKQPTGKQLTGEENLVLSDDDKEDIGDSRTKRLGDATIDRLGRAELRAIGVSRGYWGSTDSENRSGTRLTRESFRAAQKGDKRLKGEI